MTRRAPRRLMVVTALAALVSSPLAAGHGGGALGFRSTITKITPATAGISVQVLDSDDRLVLGNRTGKPLVIEGYEGEPYLSFRDGRVLRNTRSPATYLNDDRFGAVEGARKADYEPRPAGNPTLLGGAAAVVLLGGAGVVVLRRRRLSARA